MQTNLLLMKFAEIIVPLSVQGTFTYSVPDELSEDCQVGKRVLIQFGKKKFYTGIIESLHENQPEYETKPIVSVLDSKPIVSSLHIKFWKWIAEYYMCSIGEVYAAALPVSMRIESQTQIAMSKDIIDAELSENEAKIVEKLRNQKTLTISQISTFVKVKNPVNIVKKLMNKGIIDVYEHFKPSYKPKYEKYVRISDFIRTQEDLNNAFEKIARAKKQTDLLLNYIKLSELKYIDNRFIYKEVAKKKLLKTSNISSSVYKSLLEKNILTEYEKRVSRIKYSGIVSNGITKLTEIQQNAYNETLKNFQSKDVTLLYGVTSSGKTEIYINLIKHYLAQNKQVLYLLPEIALTTQIINRLQSAFGDIVGVYHSKFNDSERAEIWEKITTNSFETSKFRVILGVRSAIFLPFDNLGLIIVDEEHENTYKQFDPAPRYNARDCAIVLAKMHNAKVLLGSATPSIESYYNATIGKYGYVEIKQRYREIELPEIQLANVRTARRENQMKSLFHPLLIDSIDEALNKNEQVILFRNRRGFSPYIQCKTCGHIPYCPNCDVSLTYHSDSNSLICHYCGYKTSVPKTCSVCSDSAFETVGFGTQKIEDEIKIFFPDAVVGRLDLDVAHRKHGYEEVLNRFDKEEIDILIGTQMITKGLDFSNVNLVGVADADSLLNFPDFRSYERTFQMLTQVSGRAGRTHKRGKVIIQTSQPEHFVLKYVIDNDFEKFFEFEIEQRQKFKYPPFYRLIKINFKHKNEDEVIKFANNYAGIVKKFFRDNLSGPITPLIKRIKNYYAQQILIKMDKNISLTKSKKILLQAADYLKKKKSFSTVIVQFDVDPY